ncbi:hypothetical protein AO286_03085 [Pseudomonas syringae]|uniref:hypothetical protein n=1 Tax=Pseudomonas syringae TaxID=317 RepID=UPI000C07883E|nr:hypothetical protein [Pseudomonas syringae]PHN70086.1 hypothetical protein AO286_03085 [Pseudomonas syringae]POQ07499.1 hypothetical protein CXB40_14885 [Pseudomonas syringae pv. avii]
MIHYELFQMILNTLNSYASYNGNTTTGLQRIEIAKACEALYASVEGNPKAVVDLGVNQAVIASQELSQQLNNTSYMQEQPHHTFDAVESIRVLSPSSLDEYTQRIAN